MNEYLKKNILTKSKSNKKFLSVTKIKNVFELSYINICQEKNTYSMTDRQTDRQQHADRPMKTGQEPN